MGRRPKHLGPVPATLQPQPAARAADDGVDPSAETEPEPPYEWRDEPLPERLTPPEPVPAYRVTPTWVIELSELWHSRLETLAKREHVKPADYVEHLIRRAWVASGAGKGQP